ncbi:uncharacterized protein LOC132114593 isoform X2 [Carassius carassius]|uniref:uncharacterized protein LOC132114593 isoform X2 n=1 Tax=Carassius carassius TaxID=217509 RepID=UPI002868B065|nr:uncharacterized protein LOC132114593 isoform X2 [Carassius carassius]
MKLIFFLLVLLKSGMNSTEGLSVLYSSERIILNYLFNPSHQSLERSCCKVNQSTCYLFVNNKGQFTPMYQGRIFITNNNGEFEVIITDLSVMDAGKYGCGFSGFSYTYQFVEVTVSDLSGVNTAALSPKSNIKPDVWPSSSPSAPTVSESDAETLSDSWRTSYSLAAVFSGLVFAVISMILLVYCLKTRRKEFTDKSEICGSPNTTLEQDGIIYSMVEFKPHQDPSELYANLQIHSPKDANASSSCTVTVKETVEYSTIMRTSA